MDTEHLRTFVEVVQQGSFAAAARKFDIDPSGVTRAIANLERDLGFRLLERTTRQLMLTEAGKVYHENACKLLQHLQQAIDEARDLAGCPEGLVRVATSVSYGYAVLLPLLPALREAHPGLELDLVLSDSAIDILAERVDVALRPRQEFDTSLIGTRLVEPRYRVCASPDYLKRQSGPQTPGDLAERDCFRCALGDAQSQWKFRDAAGTVQTVEIGGWLVASNSLVLHRAALDGHGPALLADWLIAEDLAAGRLIDLFPDHDVSTADSDDAIWLLYPSRAYLPRRVRSFIEFMRQRLRSPRLSTACSEHAAQRAATPPN
jgi:DNA-binding transcriptional LysR family regulator